MSDDTVTLARAWRARLAAGYTGPVHIVIRPDDSRRVQLTYGGNVATLADFTAIYKAHAYAEQAAREYDEPDGGWWDEDTGRYRIDVAAYDRSDIAEMNRATDDWAAEVVADLHRIEADDDD